LAATKQKRKLDLISYDELLGSSSMTGLVSFLDIRPNQAHPVVEPPSRRSIEVSPELAESSTEEISVDAAPTVVVTPTVGESISALDLAADLSESVPGRSDGLTVGLSPTVVVTPTVGPTITEVDLAADLSESLPGGSDGLTVGLSPTVVVTPTVGPTITEVDLAADLSESLPGRSDGLTVGLSPTVVVTPTVGSTISEVNLAVDPSESVPSRSDGRTGGLSPTVGETPTVLSATWFAVNGGRGYEAKRVQRVTVAQQSMSLGEERVYQAIWHARPLDGITQINRRVKAFALGYDKLARLTRLNEKSIRDIIPKLIEKKILEIVRKEDSWTRTGRTYHIYSYEEILERQRAADLIYVVKNGRAVEFVRLTVGELPTVGESTTELVTPTATVGYTGSGTVGHTTTPLVSNRQATSQTSSIVREALSHYTQVDDAAIRRIINASRAHAPDCTEAEIAHFIHEKSVLVTMRGSTIKNPLGHFIATVPLCFEGETFRLFREKLSGLRTEVVDDEAQAREWGREHESDLLDPTVPEEIKQIIRKCLGN